MYADFIDRYISPFENLSWVYDEDMGFIVWRMGTGNNTELLHIKTFEKRQGNGKKLFIKMLAKLTDSPPYYSIFGFTRSNNIEAHNFYKALGFNINKVDGLYSDGECRIFWAEFNKLTYKHLKE